MKYLTITVPCFNSEEYLKRCLDSLIAGGDDVEIIVVNDGSTDRTGEIAEDYARWFPEIVTVVHKENGGHGSGVNTGLRLASGKYFKVVDSDDWLEETAYRELLRQIKQWDSLEGTDRVCTSPDLVVCNYTYNHLDEGRERTMSYRNVFPEGQICSWEEIGNFRPSQYLIMHALVYRTDVLKKIRSDFAGAHVLRGQYFCVLSIALCRNTLLHGQESVSVLFGKGRTVGE